MNYLYVTILYYAPVLCRHVCDHVVSPKISVNADCSTTLKCLVRGKWSTEQSCPTVPRQTSALELLLFCYFHTLLVHHYVLYLWNVNFTTCTQTLSYPPD